MWGWDEVEFMRRLQEAVDNERNKIMPHLYTVGGGGVSQYAQPAGGYSPPPIGMFSVLTHRMWKAVGFRTLINEQTQEEEFFVTVRKADLLENEYPQFQEFPITGDEYESMSLGDLVHVHLSVEPGIG